MKVPVRQIAEAVERAGGDVEDVTDLISCLERLHVGMEDANTRFVAGDEPAAETISKQLEAEFAKPLDEIVRDRQGRKR